jgi:hypothetical protein
MSDAEGIVEKTETIEKTEKADKTEKTDGAETTVPEQNTETLFDSSIDSRTVLRNVREALVDLFVALAKTLFFWVPGGDVVKGKALMTAHPIFLACVTAMFFMIEPRSPLRFLIVALACITVTSQWLLGGCVITRAEQRLTGSKETILDPFLVLAKISVNRDTRIAGTIGAGTAVCVMLIWAFLCDIWFGR